MILYYVEIYSMTAVKVWLSCIRHLSYVEHVVLGASSLVGPLVYLLCPLLIVDIDH